MVYSATGELGWFPRLARLLVGQPLQLPCRRNLLWRLSWGSCSFCSSERAHSTLKVYVAAISAGRGAMGDSSVGRDPMVAQFLKGAWCHRPPRELRAPPWDLRLVLRSLNGAPYEPLGQTDLKFLSCKALLLLAVCSAKRVGELHALSVNRACMSWKPEDAGVRLWPNPFFLAKVLSARASTRSSTWMPFRQNGTWVTTVGCSAQS